MATFEERELVDYTIKKFQDVNDSFITRDLDKMHSRLDRVDYKMKKILDRIERIENRISSLERCRYFNEGNKSESESESE